MGEVEKSYEGDYSVQELLTALAVHPDKYQDYKLQSGVLRYKGKVYIGKTTTLRQQLLQIMHSSTIGGHSGQQGTLKRLQLHFFWPSMKRDVQEFVSICDICQRCKDENVAQPPLVIPTQAWSDISLDFIEGLPRSQAYHPKPDGQTERLNRCLEGYLRAMVMSNPKQWVAWLHLAEWWYNTNYHTVLHSIPFHALYGYDPPQIPMGPYTDTPLQLVQDLIHQRVQFQQVLKDHIVQAQARMKWYTDQRESERELQEGDWVYLKLQSYKQTTVPLKRHLKLSPKYYGPYKKRIGPAIIPQQQLHLVGTDGKILVRPMAILQRKMVKENNVVAVKVLIQWENLSPQEATWED
ncbi:uncharacterized protein LOC107876371 [Capsicum annuum]|uniref:uncharacterized protein LOC107876371 n=1 Tax=Capsicum annuum TaxID=4072 RepID=UPI0007BED67F|nr:uncharacterized protein LOC107876371 [Capsicum annuum]